MSDDRLRSYLLGYIHERSLAPSSSWKIGEGRFYIVPEELAEFPTLDPSVRLPNNAALSVPLGDMRATPIAVPLLQLSEMVLRRPTSKVLYVHEPYLTRDDDTPLVERLTEISGQLYVQWPAREATALSMAEQVSEYFVTWSFLLLRSDPDACDIGTLFAQADLIAVAAFAGEGFVVWEAIP